jgi:hypothetical protein
MIMRRFRSILLSLSFLSLFLFSACSHAGDDLTVKIDQQEITVTREMYRGIETGVNVDDEKDYDLPLEYLFYQNGVKVVDSVEVIQDDIATTYVWREIAGSTYWRNVSQIEIDGQLYSIDQLNVQSGGFDFAVDHSITDVAALTAEALGISFGDKNSGFALSALPVEHVVWFFLDGFGYEQFQFAAQEGILPNLSVAGDFYPSYSIYPPRTSTVTAALLSGLDSTQNGVWVSGIRSLNVPSIIDAVKDSAREVLVIEGSSTPFNYPNAEVVLSGDRDGDGSTDDNVFSHAREAFQGGIPSLTMIHFHGIDDVGHTYGPYSEEWRVKVKEIDQMMGQLLQELPANTLAVIFPDHGMHTVVGDSELGNHGNLILDDMGNYIILRTE